jgi:DNA-binding MarR family transcriptional regulator
MENSNHSIGRLISILFRTGQNYISKQLEPYGIGSGQYPFLVELYEHDGASQDFLATLCQCDKANATRAIQKLEKQGYIQRERSPSDGRINLVYLTPKAHEFRMTLLGILSGWTKQLSHGMSNIDQEQTFQILSSLVKNANSIKSNENKKL